MLFLAPVLLGMIYTFAGYGVYKLFDSQPKIIIVKKVEEIKTEEKNI
jgi:hypothetical protein